MKNFKKTVASILAFTTLCGATFIPISASAVTTSSGAWGYVDNANDSGVSYDWLMNYGIEQSLITVINKGVTTTYYFDGSSEEDWNPFFVKVEDDTEVPDNINKTIKIDFDNNIIEGNDGLEIQEYHQDAFKNELGEEFPAMDGKVVNFYVLTRNRQFYQEGYLDTYNVENYDNGWVLLVSPALPIPEKDDTTIGDSENKPITEITVGDSTFPRGDINLDGKVTTVDLLMLKKYLLGLMEW